VPAVMKAKWKTPKSTTSEAPLPSVEEVPDIWWARSTSCYGKLWGGVGAREEKSN